ncbi:MAG TPA: UDP-N-acetylglucosamine 1-carboxyvinyltransferase, partial [Terricaulis sp.]|nr:UDP-N-acetylglucosamine 1-carboxyvinyltransferase [Terricaulis sp.]
GNGLPRQELVVSPQHRVLLEGARFEHLGALIKVLRAAGVDVDAQARGLRVKRNGGRLQPVDFETAPFPDFPTDLQAQVMAMLCLADGQSRIRETIFENRFMHAPELARLGAQIAVHGNEAVVTGVERLIGAPVMATDLRASVSLVIAGLAAEGETIVNRVYHLDRGFERLEAKLTACGAQVARQKEDQ